MKIICCVCGDGPAAENGAAELYAVSDVTKGGVRYCAQCIPADALEAFKDGRWKGRAVLEQRVAALWTRQVAEAKAAGNRVMSTIDDTLQIRRDEREFERAMLGAGASPEESAAYAKGD